ncbi:ABC transporter substrate-binding protein [Rhodococcus sp. IEGM 1379]|uniref:ABC transporter substrate-binding protein n=1 Tax=Rhodococcus sp. IEGM 1379 TaxID=3047086 RepID=UPI0024B7EAA9|nr:ABC transporter substrate-binding protein [Rhodococcus sp. IEGM 1379]MDI9915298.1 ABC transporter substrate-binding protein [Rhodococcus sp. IEGM 1379]
MKSTPPFATRSRRRPAAIAGLMIVALMAMVGCSSASSDEPAKADEPTTRVVQTDKGAVTVPASAERIVVLSGGLAGYLYALDAPVVATDTRVLGVTNLEGGFPPAWSDAAKKQGTTELPAGEQLSVEAVAAANPDLIIGGGQGVTSVQAEELYDKLTAIAPTVLVPRTVAAWDKQLEIVADAAGRSDQVPALMAAYDAKVKDVKGKIKIPAGNVVYILSLANNKPYLVPPTAALPAMLSELGFVADDVMTKAGNPQLFGSGDSFEVSPELLSQVADAPVAFVIPVSGRPMAELAADPLYSQLPSFKAGTTFELPATSYRPDYDGAMATLDLIGQTFG